MKSLLELPKRQYLIRQYLARQIGQRYKGTALGVLWSLASPIFMLLVYTFVFATVMHAHFGISKSETTLDYGLALFCGLNLFNFCGDVIMRSPSLILSQPNLVKKVVFPLEILPLISTLDALVHCVIAFIPLFLALAILHGTVPWSFVFLAAFLIPAALIALGLSLLLSAIGVFIRDVQNMMTPAVTVLMFGSAVFYPLATVPDWIRPWFQLNPLALIIENSRRTLIWGLPLGIPQLAFASLLGLVLVIVGFLFFEKSKPAFADVM